MNVSNRTRLVVHDGDGVGTEKHLAELLDRFIRTGDYDALREIHHIDTRLSLRRRPRLIK